MNLSRKKVEESLDVVGEVFKDIGTACREGYYKIDIKALNDLEEIVRCIKMYIILHDIKKLTGKKLEVLAYYLKFGYSKATKKGIIENIKITDSNLNNINHELRKIGVIKSIGYNQATNEVNKELLEFKKFIVDSQGKYILIKIN